MNHDTSCPDPARLKGLLESSLPECEQGELICHLDSCECCQHSLEELATGDSSWPEGVRHAGDNEPPATSAFWPALEKLQNDVLTVAPGEPEAPLIPAGEPSLDFLQPAEEPGSLGRLDRFHIAALIGRGGMGLVLKARDGCLQRDVAVKVLDPVLAHDELAHARFCREARAAAAVTHENVVTVLHVEHDEASDLPYLVMQLVTGESLQQRLDRSGALPLQDILRIGAQAAAGLAAAHAHGLIHRDVKPANILLEEGTGQVKLTDFGLARAAEDVKLTQTGFVAGTPLYMAPEQAKGEPVDHRADLFSLGSVLYALCTGRPPFGGSTPFVVLKSVTEERTRPIPELNPGIPDWLVAVIDRLHAKDPAERPQSAAEVSELLAHHLAQLRYSSEVQVPGLSSERPGVKPARTRFRTFALAVALLLLGAVALGGAAGLAHFFARPAAPPADAGGEVRPPLAVLNAGAGPVWSVAFAPDGNTLAMALDNGTVRLWDLGAGRVRSTFSAHRGAVWSVAFAPDGQTLATAGSDTTVKLWDLARGGERLSLKHAGAIRALAFSGDGKRLVSGGRDGSVTVWDLTAGKERPMVPGHAGEVVAVAFSRDGTTAASSGGDETVKLWDAATGRERLTLRGHRGGVYAVALSPDAATLASGGWDHAVRLWDVATGENRATLSGHTEDVWAVAFSPDGKTLASGSEDRTVKLWDAVGGRELATFRGHTGTLYTLAFAPDGRTLASGGRDGAVRLWRTSPSE